MNACAICNAVSDKKCSLCSNVYYCSKEHQKQDWKRHKPQCLPYRIEVNAELGRHLVASRRIGAGELVVREAPLLSGPLQATPPVCLGCYALLTSLTSVECDKCGWPVCSLKCAKGPQHRAECCVTTQYRGSKVNITHFGMVHPSYESITVLRALWMSKEHPSLWEKLSKLQSHCEERRLTEKFQQDRRAVAQFIHRFFKFADFSEDEILRVLGIINVNAHEVPISGHDYVSIYDTASYLEHNCQANCSKSFSSTGDLVIRAARCIEAGEHLSICYSDPLWGTVARRTYLRETKFFSCSCKRCADPTEFDTHFGSVRCVDGSCKGFLVPTNPLHNGNWRCSTCGSLLSHEEASGIISHATDVLSSTDKTSMQSCLKFLETFGRILHPNHYLITDVKLAVTQNLDSRVDCLSDDDLALKLLFCRQLHKLTTKLVPAENRCRGVLLFGIHAALAELGRRKSNAGEFDSNDLRNNLLECKEILTEAYNLLKHEPEILPEGQIAQQAKVNLRDIDRILHTLHANSGDSLL